MVPHIYRKLVATTIILSGFGLQYCAEAQDQPLTRDDFRKLANERRQQELLQLPEVAEVIKASNIPVPAGAKIHLVRIKNIKASVVAWWLDPAHNAEPNDFKYATQNEERIFPQLDGAYSIRQPLGENYTAPEGVSIIALNPQNTLYIVANDEAMQQLQKNIELLDKSLKQIEIETQYIQISPKDMKRLELVTADEADRPNVTTSGTFTLAFPKVNINAKIAELVKQNKVKIFTAPRVTAINTLTTEIRSTKVMPALLNIKDSTLTFTADGNSSLSATNSAPFTISVGVGFAVRPTINEDKTISLFLSPSRTIELNQPNKDKTQEPNSLILGNLNSTQSIQNLEDGDTIALIGGDMRLATSLGGKLTEGKPENLLILVTPRIVRRAGDED